MRLLDAASGEVLATARGTRAATPAPAVMDALAGSPVASPYATGALFHGPSFQAMRALTRGPKGASARLDAATGVPAGRWNPGLLDAATHAIPHDALSEWVEGLDDAWVAYPALLRSIDVFGPTPTSGEVRCEVRPDGVFGDAKHPMFAIQLIVDDHVWAVLRLVEAAFPKGPLGSAPPLDRRRFLQRQFAPSVRLSVVDGESSRLDEGVVAASNWLPGTVEAVYGSAHPAAIADAEHIAAAHGIHPYDVRHRLPLTTFNVDVREQRGALYVDGDGRGTLELSPVTAFWTKWFDRDPWPVEDLYYGLIERFVDRVVLEDAAAFGSLHKRPVLFLANHETAVESLVFSIIASALHEVPTVTVAKAEHRHTWLGRLIQHCFAYPGVEDPQVMTFFDREDRASLPGLIADLARDMAAGGRSAMVHVEGTRALNAAHRVEKMSGAFIDMALEVGAPIVPVRFTGGLPIEPLAERTEFPIGYAKQTIWFGNPLEPDTLRALHYGERKARVIEAINALGNGEVVPPGAGDEAFASAVAAHASRYGVDSEHAALAVMLRQRGSSTPETRRLLFRDARDGDTPWLAELRLRLYGE
jgi:1-acyl-sn-glycerol-3-phosphate acyltransferase